MEPPSRRCNKSACVAYLLSLLILVIFFYDLMASNRQNFLALTTLREDIDFITQSFRQPIQHTTNKIGCPGDTLFDIMEDASKKKCDPRELTAQVTEIVKRNLNPILAELYSLKKQQMSAESKIQDSKPDPKIRINFASDELGARIVHVLAQPIRGTNFFRRFLGLEFSANPPINMLRSSISPGSCFGFNGSTASIAVRLATAIMLEEIALTHIEKELTPKQCVQNAPKDFEVFGLPPNSNKRERLGQWIYDNLPTKRTQSYLVMHKGIIRNLIFVFHSNHGAKSTCIYR